MSASLDRLLESSPATTAQPEQTQPVTPNFDSITKLAESLQRDRAALTAVGYDTLLQAGLTTEAKGQYFQTEAYLRTPQNERTTGFEQPLIAVGYGARFGQPTSEDNRDSYGWIINDAVKNLQRNRLLREDSRSLGMPKTLPIHSSGLIDTGDGTTMTYVDTALRSPVQSQPITTIADRVRVAIEHAYKQHCEEQLRIRTEQEAAQHRENLALAARAQTARTLADLGGIFDIKTLENIVASWRTFYTVLFKQKIDDNPLAYGGNIQQLRQWANDTMPFPSAVLRIAPPCKGPPLYDTLVANAERFGVKISYNGDPIKPMEFDDVLPTNAGLSKTDVYSTQLFAGYSNKATQYMKPLTPLSPSEQPQDALVFLRAEDNTARLDHYSLVPKLARLEDVMLAFFAHKWSTNQRGHSDFSRVTSRLFGTYLDCTTRTCSSNGNPIIVSRIADPNTLCLVEGSVRRLINIFNCR